MTTTYDEAIPRQVKVVAALVEVARELGPIAKDDTYPGEGNWKFRGIEAIMAGLSPLLAKHGVIVTPRTSILSVVPSPAMKEGWVDTTVQVQWTIYGPEGSWIEATTIGVGRDKSDKGVNKAQTQAYKYLMLHLFAIADSASDADGIAYEPHADVPEVVIATKTVKDGFLSRIGAMSEEHKEALVTWFHENEVPAIPRLPVDRVDDVEAIISHYENLEDAEAQERE